MVDIGTKLQVPLHDDEKGWKRFYDQVTAPGYPTDITNLDPARQMENKHWMVCQLRNTVAGCDRCRAVDKRNPEMDWNHYGKN